MGEVVYQDDDVTIEKNSPEEEIDLSPESQELSPAKKGYLKIQCGCGHVGKVSEQIIEDGISWTMLFDNNHFLQLSCPKCKVTLKIYLEELENELSQESNTE